MTEKHEFRALKIDQQILDKFWTLSESGSTGIIKATDELVALLLKKEQQKNVQNVELSEELDYSVKRLVKGLASSRESARQGFSVALCQILRKFDNVEVDEYLDLIKKHLKLPKKDSKADKGNSFLGESLAYLALIQSGRLLQDDGKVIRKVVKALLWVSETRAYLRQICYNGVCLIVKQLSNEDFQQYVWPEIENVLKCGWVNCSPDVFILLVTCIKHQSDLVDKQFLKEHWQTKKLFKEDNFTKIWNVLMEGTSCYPVNHHINKEVVQEIVRNNLSQGKFWHVGQDMLFRGSQVKLLNLGFQILLELLSITSNPEEMKMLLTPETVKTWIKNVDGKLRDLNPLLPMTKSFGLELSKVMKASKDCGLQSAIIMCIVQTPAYPGNETTRTVELLIQQLGADAAKDYGNYLMESLNTNQDKLEENKRIGMLTPSDMITHLRTLVTLSSTASDHLWHLVLLQFLVLHSYWNITKESKTIKHCDYTCKDVPEKLRRQYQDNFLRSLTQLLVFKTESSKSSSVHAYRDTVYQLVTYIQSLIQETTCLVLVKPMSEEALDDWNTVYKHLQDIHSQGDSTENSLSHAFELLFLYNAIQLLTDRNKNNSSLEDLIVCYEKATERKKTDSTNTKGEPAWIEVLTELLLSMMSQNSTYARKVANNVFSCLTNQITPDALSLITQVLKVETPGEDDGQIDMEDEDKDMEEMESDLEVTDQDNEEVEEEEEESDEDTDRDESDEEVNEDFRNALKSALGPAAVENEEDEEEEEEEKEEDDGDLSDSEMFKLDDAISRVFTSMRMNREKERKETQKQLNIFKLRVLDLVETLVKSQPPADLVLDLLFHLLQLMKQKDNRELSNRATSIFKIMYKKAKIHSNSTAGTEKYLETFESLIEFSKQVFDKALVLHASDACFLVIRLLLHSEFNDSEPSPRKTRSNKDQDVKKSKVEQEQERLHEEIIKLLDTSMQLCLQKRESKLSPVFFTNILLKAPVVCWPLTKTMVDILKDKESKVFFKTQACAMLAVLINKTTHDSMEEADWEEFSSDTVQTVENIICDTDPYDIKIKLLTEMFRVLSKLINLSPNVQLSEDIDKKLMSQKKRFNTDTKRLYKTVISRIQQSQKSSIPQQKRKPDCDINQVSPTKKKKNKKIKNE